ncbi:MAG TPA: acyl carrier protein [Lacunisphaera sp.]|jgi:acyl carrier protein|nr:acyl carrier protein [Lacunisphaera sp.]
MKPSLLAPVAVPTVRDSSLRHLPADAQDAFRRFQAGGDPAGLDPVLFAILADFMPRRPEAPLAGLPGSTQLIADLGFDSLAITEVVFFTEDLFGISISNEEIVRVRSLADLRSFIRQKVAPPTGR